MPVTENERTVGTTAALAPTTPMEYECGETQAMGSKRSAWTGSSGESSEEKAGEIELSSYQREFSEAAPLVVRAVQVM